MSLADADPTDVSETFSRFGAAAALEGVVDYIVLSGSSPADLKLVHASFDIETTTIGDEVWSQTLGRALSVSATSNTRQPAMPEILRSAGFESLWTIPFESGSTHSQLVVMSRTRCTELGRACRTSSDSEAYLNACLRVLVRSLDVTRSEAIVDGEERALAFIGHEIGGLFNQLSVHAQEAILMAEESVYATWKILAHSLNPSDSWQSEIVKQIPPLSEGLEDIRRKREAVADCSAQIAAIMRMAPIVARGRSRFLRLQLSNTSIQQVLSEAKQRIEQDAEFGRTKVLSTPEEPDLRFDTGLSAPQPWAIRLPANEIMSNELVCDRYLLVVAVSSLLRNAVQFSIPRPGFRESLVRVNCEVRSGIVDFLITNWGIGIPLNEQQGLIESVTQGRIPRYRRAARGLGMGLCLSSIIAKAHGGDLCLVRSEPVDCDDRKRIRAHEVYATTFRLRVRRGLRDGHSLFDIETRRPSGQSANG